MFIKNLKYVLLCLAVTGLVFTGCDNGTTISEVEDPAAVNAGVDAIEGQYIVVYKNFDLSGKASISRDLVAETTDEVLSDNGIDEETVLNYYNTVFQGFVGKLTLDQVNNLRTDSRIAYIEQDQFVALAPPPGKGPNRGGDDDGGSDPTQTTPWGITRVGGPVDGTGKTVWVLDSGVDLDHPDLNVDVARSRTFFTSGKDSKSADDGNGHGTHVAGTIGALDNNIGVVGVAPNATIVAVKVLDSRGGGSISSVVGGIDYVAANAGNGDVANMSLGGGASQALDDAVLAAAQSGVLFALAAGNESTDAATKSPARVNHPNVYTVSATDINDGFASFSNFGNPPVDYAAPGVGILSTYKSGGYATLNGTSMASPHVAGILAVTGGTIRTVGTAVGDPDGDADPIAGI